VNKPIGADTTFVYSADGARIKRAHGGAATYYIGPIEIETNQGDVTETHTIYDLGGGVNVVRVVTSPGDDGEITFTFGIIWAAHRPSGRRVSWVTPTPG
jgi:hypothetical protein